MTLKALLLLCAIVCASAVKEGDEVLDETPIGHFYVFADQVIHIIDPVTQTITKNITKDNAGLPLTNEGAIGGAANHSRTWNDVVRIEDEGRSLYYVVVNEGDVYNDTQTGNLYSYVTFIDTVQQAIVARVQVGARPVHLYSVLPTREVWSHSDATADLYVIGVDTPENITVEVVPASFKTTGHGKLLLDNTLFPVGYVSNVNEQNITQVNLVTRERTGEFGFDIAGSGVDPTICPGTHSLVYSNASQHAYFECVDHGIIEWDTVTNKLVQYLSNTTGYLTITPANDKILATNADTSEVTVLQPTANGQPATVLYTIQVPGNPAPPVFYANYTGTNVLEAEDYNIFFPLLRDTNKNNIAAAENAGGSVTDPGYFNQPIDCQYNNVATDPASSGLRLATASNGTVLTPLCGTCAAGFTPRNASQWDSNLSGIRWTNFTQIEKAALHGTDAIAEFIPCGAIYLYPAGGSDSNACSFAEANRAIARGGPYIITVADFPQESVYLVDASGPGGPKEVGFVKTSTNPVKVRWMPNHISS